MKLIFRIIGKLESWVMLGGTVVLFFAGLLVNRYFPTNLFILKFFLLFGILNILIFSARHYNTFIINDFLRASEDPVLSAEKLRLKNRIFSSYNILLGLTLSLFFISISIYLKFINLNITGIISLVLLFATIFISIIGYMLYVHLISFLYKLGNADIEKYSKFYPAYTRWLVDITKYSSLYQNSFLISGTLYVILFAIHAPADTLKILSFTSPYNFQDIILCAAWIVILFAVLAGFPLIAYLRSRVIKTIISNLKIKSSEYYQSVVDRVEIDKQINYIKLIKEIMESPDYPVKMGINTIISSATLILNLAVTILKLFPNIIK